MTAHDFLEKLEQNGTIDSKLVSTLRKKISQPGKELSARRVAKYLVSKGYLTESQAEKMLDREDDDSEVPMLSEDDLISDLVAAPAASPEKSTSKESSSSSSSSSSKKQKSKRKTSKKRSSATEAQLVEDDDIVDLSAAPNAADAMLNENLGDFTNTDPLGEQGEGPEKDEEDRQVDKVAEARARFNSKAVVENQWDASKWIFIGPTIVILLLLGTAGLYFVLARGNAQERYEAIIESYRGLKYSEAIERADEFLETWPRHEQSDRVRVMRGMARMRIPVESRDWDEALVQFEETLPQIKDNEAFPDARDDMPALILQTAEGFSLQAEQTEDINAAEALVGEAKKVMALSQNAEYITSAQRRVPANQSAILRIDEAIIRVERDIKQERRLRSAIADIDEALNEKDAAKGFAIHKGLLSEYPILETDPRLVEAVLKVSNMERDLVAVSEVNIAPITEGNDSLEVGVHVIATQSGKEIPTLDGEVLPLLIRGSVYGFNAGTGAVLWRKYVGIASQFQPQFIDPQQTPDLLIVNGEKNELSRVDSKTGDTLWTTQVGEGFSNPVLANERAYLSTRNGRIVEVDLVSGVVTREVKVPQPLYASACTGPRARDLYQPGLHSNLYVLSSSTLECQEVFYLGHPAGSIEVAPVFTSGYLFVAENSPAGTSSKEYTRIHILEPKADGLVAAQTPIRLDGKVVAPLTLYDRKVLVVTDVGDIALLDVDGPETRPVAAIAEFKLESDPTVEDHLAIENGVMWFGDRGLTSFQVQAQRGKFDRKVATNSGDIFVAPITILGDYVLHARIRRGSSLVSVSAVDGEGAEEIWRTDLGAPLAGEPIVKNDSGELTAVSAQGDQFVFDENGIAGFSAEVADRRGSTSMQDLVFPYLISLEDGRALGIGPGPFVRGANGGEFRALQFVSMDPQQTTATSRIISYDLPFANLVTEPVAFGSGALLASSAGQILYVDATTGKDAAIPFQPAIEPDVQIVWRRPVAINDSEFIACDSRGSFYRVGVKPGSPATMGKLGEYKHRKRIMSEIAVIDQYAYAIAQGEGGEELIAIKVSDMTLGSNAALGGRVVAGLEQANNMLFAVLDDGKLHAFAPDLNERWSVDVGGSTIVGPPAMVENDLVFALNRGRVIRVDSETGNVNASIDAGEPIVHPPVIFGDRVVLNSADGTLLVFPLP